MNEDERRRQMSEKEKDLRLGLFAKLSAMIDGINYMQVRETELLGENERVQLMTIKLDLQKMILSLEGKGKE